MAVNLLPPVLLPFICAHPGYGGIAVNADGTLFASVNIEQH
jgi:hypothetical protein